MATAGQLVADRGGIDLRARHFELGESHQYVHASASDRRVARATRQRGSSPVQPGHVIGHAFGHSLELAVIADAAQLGEIRLGEALVATLR